MPDPQTLNLQLNIPAHLSDPGTWDASLNTNFQAIDNIWGGVANVGVTGGGVTLVPAQWQCQMIVFSGNLGGDAVVTFPSLGSHHAVINRTTGNFNVVLVCGGGRAIALPRGEWLDILTDGTNVDFRNLYGPIGSYVDLAATGLPSWVNACSVPPLLLCDGSTFNSGTYSVLASILGGNVLPDTRGRTRFSFDSVGTRITVGISGINGASLFAAGGNEATQQHLHSITDVQHSHTYHDLQLFAPYQGGGGLGAVTGYAGTGGQTTGPSFTGITATNNFGAGGSQNMPPAYIGGITLIRGF